MCTSCFSAMESVVICGTGAWSLIGRARQNRRLARIGIDSTDRSRRRWDHTAAFLATVGHDPVAVLGPRPAESPAPAGAEPVSVPLEPVGERLPAGSAVRR